MTRISIIIMLALSALLIGNIAGARATQGEQIMGLDEQVQEIKSDVLSIATKLSLLEKKLLYPTNSEVSIFVSLPQKETFRLDSLDLKLDDKEVAHHLYTYKELEALRKGGVQRLYTGHITTGKHPLAVTFRGKNADGRAIEKTGIFTVQKEATPGIVEIILTEQAISFKNK